MPRLKDDPIAPSLSGIGEEELLDTYEGKPDYNRGAGGEPLIAMPDGKQERYARTSSLGETLDEKSALNAWLVSKAMEGMGRKPELVAKVIAVTPYDDHKPAWGALREEAIQAGRGAYRADLGTAVHSMSERWEKEPEFDPGPPYAAALTAYSACLERLGLISQMFEVQMVNDVLRIAGTADRLFETTVPLLTPTGDILLPGTLIIGDLKTGDSLEYAIAGYSIQLAGYAGGVLYDVVNNVRMPTPTIHQRWAIIMHLNVEHGTCEFLWVDLEVGRFGAHLANEVREWRRNWRRKEGYKAGIQEIQVAPVDVDEELHEKWAEAETAPSPGMVSALPSIVEESAITVDDWRQYCRLRLADIRENTEAKEWMLVRWPTTLKAPKALETIDEALALAKFLDRVEAEFGMQFSHAAPRPPAARRR